MPGMVPGGVSSFKADYLKNYTDKFLAGSPTKNLGPEKKVEYLTSDIPMMIEA
jgi:hypothetical protein